MYYLLLVGNLQLGLAGEHDREVVTDLLRTSILPPSCLHYSGKQPVVELAALGPEALITQRFCAA